ncbi:hypothetical protein PVK06_029860 [Gossypium arboreum]|uniref:Uncharacterized protein n=1 Tax=Gossypium arboreum TaxID=29729 RepID=A0ABR0NLX7_GOSAR|nr:hypothetical protein PVK06_029860 [Gossypium arboreum]
MKYVEVIANRRQWKKSNCCSAKPEESCQQIPTTSTRVAVGEDDCDSIEESCNEIESARESCNRKAEASNKTDWLKIISFVVALLAMVIATFSTGIDSQCFQFSKKEARAEDTVPYGYGFFHFVFATGAMYFAMLVIGWNTHHTIKRWTIDVGWTSTWVRIVNEWLAVCVYLTTVTELGNGKPKFYSTPEVIAFCRKWRLPTNHILKVRQRIQSLQAGKAKA